MTHYLNPIYLLKQAQALLYRELSSTRCIKTLQISISLGLFIAFSPFVGLHNIMVVVCSWWFSLSLPLLLLISHLNNPWTMAPIYYADYAFGEWIITSLGVDASRFAPEWIGLFNQQVKWLVGLEICLITFMIGGILLAFIVAMVSYLCMRVYMGSTTR